MLKVLENPSNSREALLNHWMLRTLRVDGMDAEYAVDAEDACTAVAVWLLVLLVLQYYY
jgi:hypothetical protein